MRSGTAVFSVASGSHLARVKTLMASIAQHQPDWARFLVLSDRVEDSFVSSGEEFEVVAAESLSIPGFRRMSFQYTPVELACSLKPSGFKYLLDLGFERVVYLDSDIFVYGPMVEVGRALDDHDIVLVPHSTEPMPDDGKQPSDQNIVFHGTYNAGFVGLRRSASADSLLEWWGNRLQDDCRAEPATGVFLDQKWLDLVPVLMTSSLVLKNQGYNVAYWNLHDRPISRDAKGIVRAAGEPLVFVHFSGFSPGNDGKGMGGDRYSLADLDDTTCALFDDYGKAVRSSEEQCNGPLNAFSMFSDGTRIHDSFRIHFREELTKSGKDYDDPFDADQGDVLSYLLSRWDDDSAFTGATVAFYVHVMRSRWGYDAPLHDQVAFADWFVNGAGERAGVDRKFCEAQADLLAEVRRARGPMLPPLPARLFSLMRPDDAAYVRVCHAYLDVMSHPAVRGYRRLKRLFKRSEKTNTPGSREGS